LDTLKVLDHRKSLQWMRMVTFSVQVARQEWELEMGGMQNFLQQHGSAAQCATNKKKWQVKDSLTKTKEKAMKWFQAWASAIPPTVTEPAVVNQTLQVLWALTSSSSMGNSVPNPPPPPLSGCPIGIALLQRFQTHIEALPPDVSKADESHPLAAFAGDPVGCVGNNKDAWEKLDGPLNTLLQKSPNDLQLLIQVGGRGLIGLCRLLEYLVLHHKLTGYLFEGKLEWLTHAMDEVWVT
jgi:hypothetical protein